MTWNIRKQKRPNQNSRKSPTHLRHGLASHALLCRWAPWPSTPIPANHDHTLRPMRSSCQGLYQSTSKSIEAIPSSASIMATNNYYWCCLCSTFSNSSCGSAKYHGEDIPHHPGLPKADLGHWSVSFFFEKSTLLLMATVFESPKHLKSP